MRKSAGSTASCVYGAAGQNASKPRSIKVTTKPERDRFEQLFGDRTRHRRCPFNRDCGLVASDACDSRPDDLHGTGSIQFNITAERVLGHQRDHAGRSVMPAPRIRSIRPSEFLGPYVATCWSGGRARVFVV
jgi:hypothetical protein